MLCYTFAYLILQPLSPYPHYCSAQSLHITNNAKLFHHFFLCVDGMGLVIVVDLEPHHLNAERNDYLGD